MNLYLCGMVSIQYEQHLHKICVEGRIRMLFLQAGESQAFPETGHDIQISEVTSSDKTHFSENTTVLLKPYCWWSIPTIANKCIPPASLILMEKKANTLAMTPEPHSVFKKLFHVFVFLMKLALFTLSALLTMWLLLHRIRFHPQCCHF